MYCPTKTRFNQLDIYVFLDTKNMKLQKLIAIDANQRNSIIKPCKICAIKATFIK